MTLEFDRFAAPLLFDVDGVPPGQSAPPTASKHQYDSETHFIFKALTRDPLYNFSQDEKVLLFRHRQSYSDQAKNLYKFAQSVDYMDRGQVAELHRMLGVWAPIEPLDAVGLLDGKYPDTEVRAYACDRLRLIGDDEFGLLLVQLVQCLKYERHHRSALCSLLLERAIKCPEQVGHALAWHLRSEIEHHRFTERCTLMLEELLSHSNAFAQDMSAEVKTVDILTSVAVSIKGVNKNMRGDLLRAELDRLNKQLPLKFSMCIDPRKEAHALVLEKCKVMSSKKLPLWVVLDNADPEGDPVNTIFKCGDDLRQDMLTLQLIQLMDQFWLSSGLDLRMNPYTVVSTAYMVGLIEVVMGADTTSNIQIEKGGQLMGAITDDVLLKWLQQHNPEEDQLAKAVDTFTRSCAGYCVATYVLGIGDRHNGNIMLRKNGQLFHIDFGHFLGNFKSKFGINRERAPFVLTPEMVHVMGGRKSKIFNEQFLPSCFAAYTILRKYAWQLLQLFQVMIAAEMPELTSPGDLQYLRDMLSLDMSDEQANKKFEREVHLSLDTTWRRIDNLIHNMKHG